MLAAKEAHKQMLRKYKSKWHELLMDESDSDTENDKFDQLNINIKNLNFNSMTNNYYSSTATNNNKTKSQFDHSDRLNNHNIVSKRQRNQLKTNNLRKSVTKMMSSTPNQSRIWNIDLADDNSKTNH